MGSRSFYDKCYQLLFLFNVDLINLIEYFSLCILPSLYERTKSNIQLIQLNPSITPSFSWQLTRPPLQLPPKTNDNATNEEQRAR